MKEQMDGEGPKGCNRGVNMYLDKWAEMHVHSENMWKAWKEQDTQNLPIGSDHWPI